MSSKNSCLLERLTVKYRTNCGKLYKMNKKIQNQAIKCSEYRKQKNLILLDV